jgi:hypothetical protein
MLILLASIVSAGLMLGALLRAELMWPSMQLKDLVGHNWSSFEWK